MVKPSLANQTPRAARIWLALLGLAGCLLVASCKPNAPPPVPAPVPPTPQAKVAPAATSAKLVEPATDPAAVTPAEAEAATTPDTEKPAVDAPTAVAAPPEAPPTYGVERILVFMAQSPLIVELQLSIDGLPHETALDELVEQVLTLADTDSDGRASWSEITASPRFKYGQFGNLPIEGDNGMKQIVERYDIDRDGIVDAEELPRFLTRNAGGSRSFSIRGTVDDSAGGRRAAALWQVLDGDDDGRLSAEEMTSAPARMHARDADDDEILVSTELMPSTAMMMPDMRPRRRSGREATRLLGAHAQWDAVRTTLEEQYALGGALKREDFPLTPTLFAELDANSDGRVRRKEWERLNEATPHVRIAVSFGSPAKTAEAEEAPAGTPRVRLVEFSDALQGEHSATQIADDRLLLRIAGNSLLVYFNDQLAQMNYEQQAEQSLAMFDADKNGYLEASEIPEQAQATVGRIEAVDTDGDGKVYAGEVAAYLAQQQQTLRSQVHARVAGQTDGLRNSLDRNDDGRLDSREIEAAPNRLRELDRNADGEVDLDELPSGLMLGIARGNLENQEALFTLPSSVSTGPTTDAPRWFQQMDANRDGGISPREFLGPVEMFEKFDADDDGFLTPGEAVAT